MGKINKIIYQTLLLLLFTTNTSCYMNNNDLNQKIKKAYESCEDKKNCMVDFKKVFNFNWDFVSLISLNRDMLAGEISSIINAPYNRDLKEFTRILVFTKNNEVVKEYVNVYDSDGLLSPDIRPLSVEFSNQFIKKLPSDSALFKLEKKENYYYLSKF